MIHLWSKVIKPSFTHSFLNQLNNRNQGLDRYSIAELAFPDKEPACLTLQFVPVRKNATRLAFERKSYFAGLKVNIID
jgi:hypothetical protein